MNNISDLLSKFKTLLNKDSAVKEEVVRILSDILKIKLNSSDVEVKNGLVYVKASPLIKNEIFINKAEILRHLKDLPVKDIR